MGDNFLIFKTLRLCCFYARLRAISGIFLRHIGLGSQSNFAPFINLKFRVQVNHYLFLMTYERKVAGCRFDSQIRQT